MISQSLLNDIIKTKEFLITGELVLRRKLNDNMVDIIMNYVSPFRRITKENLKKSFGLIALLTNRIYYMYNNDIPDWMNYYNYNLKQVIRWNSLKINLNYLNDIYSIIIYLLKSHFNFNVLTYDNNYSNDNFKLKINDTLFIINLDKDIKEDADIFNIYSNKSHKYKTSYIFEINKNN